MIMSTIDIDKITSTPEWRETMRKAAEAIEYFRRLQATTEDLRLARALEVYLKHVGEANRP
jgi:hypothetical protein